MRPSRSKQYPVCECGTKITAKGYDRCARCRHNTRLRDQQRLCGCGTPIRGDSEDKCSRCRKAGRHCACGRGIRNPLNDRCSFCLSGKRSPTDVDDLIKDTEIIWEPDTWGVLRAVVVKDPIPDGPTRAARRMFQDVT